MSYPALPLDYPPLADLSLNAFDAARPWPQPISGSHFPSYDAIHSQRFSPQSAYSDHRPSSAYSIPHTSTVYHNPSLSLGTPWDILLPAYSKEDTDNFFPLVPELEFPPSPSDTCSSSSNDVTSPSYPQPVHVVCKAPLVAPIPLPYHSPTFLQFELPDIDQDLSHPPYTRRASKRKRVIEEDLDEHASKKRSVIPSWAPYSHRISGYTSMRHQSAGHRTRSTRYHT